MRLKRILAKYEKYGNLCMHLCLSSKPKLHHANFVTPPSSGEQLWAKSNALVWGKVWKIPEKKTHALYFWTSIWVLHAQISCQNMLFHIFGVKAEKGKNWYRPTFGCKLLKQICSIFLHFLLFLHFCAKKVYFNQHLECAAPKYTFTTYITQEQLHIHSVPKTPRFSRVCLSVLDGLGGLTNSFKNSNAQQLS